MFLTTFIIILPVFGIVVLGFLSQRLRFMPPEMASCLNQFVYWIALPALLFHEMSAMNTGDLPGIFVLALCGNALGALALVFVLLRLWPNRLSGRKAGMNALYATFPNSAFVGLPVIALLWPGNSFALLSGSLSAVVYTVLLVAGDVALQTSEGSQQQGTDGIRRFLRKTGGTLWRNPLLMSTLVGLVWNLLGLPLPAPLRTATGMLRSTAAPCALFCMGMLLAGQMDLLGRQGRRIGKRVFAPQITVHLFRLVLHPLLAWAILSPLGISTVLVGTSILQAAMPTGLASYVVAEKHRIDPENAPIIIMISTVLSVLTIPAVAALLRMYGLV